MLIRNISNFFKSNKCSLRRISYKIGNDSHFGKEISKIRNIGVFAHIDAGKTTTTERMLYYAGLIHQMGEVHHGNTVTDYMDQERERGITIRSAAVTFQWKNYFFNLIDTPGHIDFTMEVEQSLNILDGAIIIIDGSAGVEAQTSTVWRQADRYEIPRIIYINKMDKPKADIEDSLKSISEKLNVPTLMLQIPLYKDGMFIGVTDLITLNNLIWNQKMDEKNYLKEQIHQDNLDHVLNKRINLIDQLAEQDDIIAESLINKGSYDNLSTNEIIDSIKRITLLNKGVPVICGSSYKNTGVQLLMDAVIDYLPSPNECNKQVEGIFHNHLCAKVFKIIHDDNKKPITYFRIYSGNLSKEQKIYNVNQEKMEQIGKLSIAFADELKEMDKIFQGNIAAVYGMKWSKPGDIITDKLSTANFVKEKLSEECNQRVLRVINMDTQIPDPVFFCSVEVDSQLYQKKLEEALNELQREDPSLKVNFDEETGQTILGGMGELHLEIIKNRLIQEYKLDVDTGPLFIAYKETIVQNMQDSFTLQTKIGSSKHYVKIEITLFPLQNKNVFEFSLDKNPENASNLASITPKQMNILNQGLKYALNQGPKIKCQMYNVGAKLNWFETTRSTSDTLIISSVYKCIEKILKNKETFILEPVMNLEIVAYQDYLSRIISDLSNRRSTILKITPNLDNKIIECLTPLSTLQGYSSFIRKITSGKVNFSMEFNSFQIVSQEEETKLMATFF